MMNPPMAGVDTLRLHDLVLTQAARTPDALAVQAVNGALTYAELVAEAKVRRDRFVAAGVGPDSIVMVCAERSIGLLPVLLGILWAGGAYLPIDRTFPPRRITHLIQESRPVAVVCDDQDHELVRRAGVRSPANLLGEGLPHGIRRPAGVPGPAHLAYVIYTSGSTGTPKGVGVPHRGVVNRLLWMQAEFGLQPDDVVLQKTPLTFDVSVWELFWPLIAGARLVLAVPEGHRDPSYLIEVIRRERVSTIHFVPSMLEHFVRQPGLAACVSLRRVIASGEALSSSLANRWASAHPAALHNLYGPTEASIDVTAWRCRGNEPGPGVPIGRPIAGVSAHVVRPDGSRCGPGETGELLIGGVCLARGYVGRPDLTQRAFAPWPGPGDPIHYRTGDRARWAGDGCLEYVGRADHQVKLRGHRIELGEIEATMTSYGPVQTAVVLLSDSISGPSLTAYAVFDGPAEPDGLLRHLTAHLPAVMLPKYLVVMTSMPVTANGKLDRTALPQPGPEHLLRRRTAVETSPSP